MDIRRNIHKFSKSDRLRPTTYALAAGFYPLIHYYNTNFLMVNSWPQLMWFLIVFIILPIIVFYIASFLVKRFSILKSYKGHIFTGLNIFVFSNLLLFVTYGLTKKHLLIMGLLALLLMFVLHKYYKKLILIQFLMTLVTLVLFLPKLFSYYNYSNDWMLLPDTIDKVVLKETPNIYVIQPDGYTNFNELEKAPYNYDNSEFKRYLESNEFTIYDNNRSNYFSTLTSNASMFAMKHHYYMKSVGANETQYDYRKGLAGDNNTVKILKNNGYKTFMLLGFPYIIINRPKKEIDVINYDYSSMSYIGNKWKGKFPLDTLEYLMTKNKTTHNFFFIEKILPTHIENLKSKSRGVEGERKAYLERLEESNNWLKQVIETITSNDKEGIIVLVSDHGGYVGLESAEDVYSKLENSALKKSVFSSLLAIKWSNNGAPKFDDQLKSNVNLFRVLFAHLSQNETYLQYLEDDKSYITIKKKAPKGVYEYIDNSGQPAFNKLSN
ncbi:hypothetical protein [uncultured Winogradskyella sp.]|uniref:hypothetical protein n=1 Tax=uncultured Winogradskyella sp. TaxID=395353 RepID=UPI00262CBAFE|nr:hypothetical protein [uncultured Winogradskyella sp.]